MDHSRLAPTAPLLFAAILYLGCGSNAPAPNPSPRTGGESASAGGHSESGGTPASGGSSASGGTMAEGGSSGSGGSPSSGGASASGGSSASGGTQAAGGTADTGGSQASGGSTGRGDAGPSDSGRGQGGSSNTGGSGTGIAAGGSGGSGGSSGSTGGGGMTGAGGGTSSSYWPSPYKATTGSNGMNTGQNCMSSCHNHGFAFGGTVYDASGKAKSQVEVGVKLTSGQFISVFSGSDGNFYYRGSGLNLAGADIRVRDGAGESSMPPTSTSSGACNSCHTGTGTPRIAAP